MRYMTAGESHGPQLTAIVDGVPAGLRISEAAINADLARRQSGYGRGGRQLIEKDVVRILSGVRFGRTIGSPIALVVDRAQDALEVSDHSPVIFTFRLSHGRTSAIHP